MKYTSCVFSPAIKEACAEAEDTAGFGPEMVRAIAALVVVEKMALPADDAGVWMPSKDWAYWFLRHEREGALAWCRWLDAPSRTGRRLRHSLRSPAGLVSRRDPATSTGRCFAFWSRVAVV